MIYNEKSKKKCKIPKKPISGGFFHVNFFGFFGANPAERTCRSKRTMSGQNLSEGSTRLTIVVLGKIVLYSIGGGGGIFIRIFWGGGKVAPPPLQKTIRVIV